MQNCRFGTLVFSSLGPSCICGTLSKALIRLLQQVRMCCNGWKVMLQVAGCILAAALRARAITVSWCWESLKLPFLIIPHSVPSCEPPQPAGHPPLGRGHSGHRWRFPKSPAACDLIRADLHAAAPAPPEGGQQGSWGPEPHGDGQFAEAVNMDLRGGA